MTLNTFIVTTVDSCAFAADQLHPETGSSVPDSVDRIGRYFDGLATQSFTFDTISVELGMSQAKGSITFSLIAAGDTITIGNTVFTGTNGTPTSSQFQTNASPSAANDVIAAASLAAAIKANATTSLLVTSSNVVFYVTTVTDDTHLVVSSTTGLVAGQSITQGSHNTTITTVTDSTHLVVASTTSWTGGVAGTPVVKIVVQTPGVIGNFVPVLISGHGIVSGSASGPTNAYLLTASTYAVLAQSGITNTGNTILNGDLGISPAAGSTVTGFPPGLVNGTKHLTDAAAAQAHTDATAAEVALAALVTSSNTDISSQDLGSYVAVPGNYKATVAGTWSAGPLTLNGAGTYIFQFGTSLTLPANASIILANGATADNVYFITGTTFIFGASNTTFGTVLAGTAITTAAGTNHTGRLLTYGSSGTAVTIPSAAVINNPLVSSGLGGGVDGSCLPKVILA